jgi:transglutaminase-like putative cysteine protease
VGTQAPAETLRRGSGTCRDFALFMMEAARCLGLAARFVSGYLYDESWPQDPANSVSQSHPANSVSQSHPANTVSPTHPATALVGGGATHAWVQIYLPGAGWTEFDPTNALAGGRNLVRVGVTRDPAQAVPLSGTYVGAAADFLDMRIDVTLTAQ